MKMLVLVYSGPAPQRISSLLDRHHAGGYTELRDAHGSGSTGRREGSRTWPGESTLWVSVVPDGESETLIGALRTETTRLSQGERLHVATLPTESFF